MRRGQDHQVNSTRDRHLFIMLPEAFPYQTFQAISFYRLLTGFTGNCHTQAAKVLFIIPCKDPEIRITRGTRFGKHKAEICLRAQSLLAGKSHCMAPLVLPLWVSFGAMGIFAVNQLPKYRPLNQAERRLRPLARRALIMALPLRVAMRARKPCRRARFKRLG